MTALTGTRRVDLVATAASRTRYGKVKADAVIYKGALLCAVAGYLVAAANTAGYKVVGIAQQTVDNTGGNDGDVEVQYITGVSATFKNDGTNDVDQTNIGGPVWVQDDQTVRGNPGNGVLAGLAEGFDAAGNVIVFVDPDGAGRWINIPYVIRYEHAAATADATHELDKIPAGYQFRLTGVDYINPTGLAQDATNAFIVKVIKNATVMASWSTLTGAQGSIAANTFVSLVNSNTDADLVAAAGDIISLFLDEQGDTTLPLGRVVIRGELLPA